MALIDKNTIEQDNSDPLYQQISQMSPEQRNALKALATRELTKARMESVIPIQEVDPSRGMRFLTNTFLQRGGLNTIEKPKTSDLNDYIAKEMFKSRMDQIDPYKQSQIALNNAMLENIKGGRTEGGDLIYRDPATGLEIPKEQALSDIAQGKQYVVNRRVATRQGVREEGVSKPEDLTQEEKQYLITTKRVTGSLDALHKDIYPKLDAMGGNKDWQAFQAEKVPFALIGNQSIEDYKSAITQLKADIPFLRGGKQLTATEAKRVDILLNPFGKSPETRGKDIKRFQDEFLGGAELMKGGIRTLNKGIGTQNIPTSAGQPSTGFKIIAKRPIGS